MDQDVFLFSRKRMEISGVEEVESFSDTGITALTALGHLTVEGGELRIESFSAEAGKLVIRGSVDSFSYDGDDSEAPRRGFFGRWFR